MLALALEMMQDVKGPRPGEECQCSSRMNDEYDPTPVTTEECHIFCPVCHAPIRTEVFKAHVHEVHGYVECRRCGHDVDPREHRTHHVRHTGSRR